MSFKSKIIKFLGGYTAREYVRASKQSYDLGRRSGENRAAMYLITYAKSIYGNSAEDWADKMYKQINIFLQEKHRDETV